MAARFRLPLSAGATQIRSLLPRLVKKLEEGFNGQAYGFVFFEESLDKNINAGKIESAGSNLDRGLVLRLLINGKNYESATNDLTEANLQELASDLNRRVAALEPNPGPLTFHPQSWAAEPREGLCADILAQLPADGEENSGVHFGVAVEQHPFTPGSEEIMKRARRLREEIIARDAAYCSEQKLEPLAMVNVAYRLKVVHNIFVDRMRNMSQSLPLVVVYALGQTRSGKMGRAILGGMGGLEAAVIGEEDFQQVVEVPHRLDTAELLQPGTYQVITGPDITGVFAHEAFGHTQEADTCRQGRSITAQLAGEKVGNEHATIINNAAVFTMAQQSYGTNGSYFFDHEGQLARENVILDRGVLCPPMTDLLSALHLGIRRTASGKRESWRRPTLTRQTNTYFTAGDKTLAQLIGMIRGTGYIATQAHGGMEDPKGANLTAGAEFFEEIVDGRLTGRFFLGPKGGHIELSGFVPDLLKGIRAKSKIDFNTSEPDECNIPENKLGGCGKFHKEYVPAGCGGPYILWDKVTCG